MTYLLAFRAAGIVALIVLIGAAAWAAYRHVYNSGVAAAQLECRVLMSSLADAHTAKVTAVQAQASAAAQDAAAAVEAYRAMAARSLRSVNAPKPVAVNSVDPAPKPEPPMLPDLVSEQLASTIYELHAAAISATSGAKP